MKRYSYIIPILLLGNFSGLAQTATKNYVMTETMLNATSSQEIKAVQYYDGLGRPSELATGGQHYMGQYLHTLQTYDAAGREDVITLPAVGGMNPVFKGMTKNSNFLNQTYDDTRCYSQTTYDALDRPTFISTPGQNWTDKGKSISYVTNAANSVKRYTAGSSTATYSGYYPEGELTGEVQTDEDGITVTTYKDLMGRVVLERRGNNDDTYYVYGSDGLLYFVLQPMFQQSASNYYRYRYTYDAHGRMTGKYEPGSNVPTLYRYDSEGRLIAERDRRVTPVNRSRFYLYDRLGRLCVQGNTSNYPQSSTAPAYVSRTSASGFYQVCGSGYYVRNGFTLQNPVVEAIYYYDDYSFLSTTACAALIGNNDFTLSNPVCATSLPTGVITATSDGRRLLSVNYYDAKGNLTDQRQTTLDGGFLRTVTTYDFTDKPLTVENTLTTGGLTFHFSEANTYKATSGQLQMTSLTYNNDTTVQVRKLTYDQLGRIQKEEQHGGRFSTTFGYNLHGWLTSILSSNTATATDLFSQNLYYETGVGTPSYNGNISTMQWKTGTNGHGYLFNYDVRNRLTAATYGNYNISPLGYLNSETIAYNRNSAITSLTRTGNSLAGYGNIDQLTYSYTGNRLKAIDDLASSNIYDGSFEFVNGSIATTEYEYNAAGDLTQDKNKGIALINYDLLGHPTRIQLTNGNVTEYVYAADGRKLREKHSTAVDGLSVNYGQTLELTPAQIMSVDSVDYVENMKVKVLSSNSTISSRECDYHFDGGYLAATHFRITLPLSNPVEGDYEAFYYYLRDHQGNNHVVVNGSGTVEQTNDYYAYGGPWGDACTNQGFQPFKYNGKELDRIHGLDWYDYGARRYDPAVGMFTQVDPLCEQYPHLNPYLYCAGNPVNYVDPDGRAWYQTLYGSIRWTEYRSQEELDKERIDGRYLGEVVLLFNGSRNERLGTNDNLFGDGAVLAKATLYGRDGADDITEFDGFTMSSDFKTFGAIADGEYTVNHKEIGKKGPLSSHWAINNANPVDCLDGINPSPISPFSSTQKDGVYIHRSNNNGKAGKIFKKGKLSGAVSTGCLLIVPSKYDAHGRAINNGWDQFNSKLTGVKSFKLILKRK